MNRKELAEKYGVDKEFVTCSKCKFGLVIVAGPMDILDKIAICDDARCGDCELDELRRRHTGGFIVCMGKLLNEAAEEIRKLREELNG